MTYRSYLVATVILVVGGSLVYAAPRSARVSKETRIRVAPQKDEVREDWRVTAALQEDGSWAVAGVVGLSKDVLGRNVIEVKKDGDFETDAVLSLFVPLVELDTGEVVAGGIVSVKDNGDTVTLTVREVAPLDDNAKPGAGKVVEPKPQKQDGCEGGFHEGHFICIQYTEICTTICDKKDIIPGVQHCACNPTPAK